MGLLVAQALEQAGLQAGQSSSQEGVEQQPHMSRLKQGVSLSGPGCIRARANPDGWPSPCCLPSREPTSVIAGLLSGV